MTRSASVTQAELEILREVAGIAPDVPIYSETDLKRRIAVRLAAIRSVVRKGLVRRGGNLPELTDAGRKLLGLPSPANGSGDGRRRE